MPVAPKPVPQSAEVMRVIVDIADTLEIVRRYLRAKNFDAAGRDAVAFIIETAIAKAAQVTGAK